MLDQEINELDIVFTTASMATVEMDHELVKSINDLPEEILEVILFELSPYNDLKAAMQVCSSWYRVTKGEMIMVDCYRPVNCFLFSCELTDNPLKSYNKMDANAALAGRV